MAALLYTLGVFGFILLLARLKVPLAAAILAGAVLAGSLFGLGPDRLLWTAAAGAVCPTTLALVAIVALLLCLSETMRVGGQLRQMVSLARAFLRRPLLAMATLPALIGLLPMPGGALFSAPMVASAAGETKVGGGLLSAINYWFRHVWEHWWPLYPGVILAVTLTRSGLGSFMAFQVPLGLFMILGGLAIFRGAHPDLRLAAEPAPAGTKRKLLRATSSIWIIMLVWAVVAGLLVAVFGPPPRPLPDGPDPSARKQALALAHRLVPITAGLLVSLVWTIRMNRLTARQVAGVLTRRSLYSLIALIVSVMVFQHVLHEVGAARRIGVELTERNVPVEVVVAVLPFVAGLVTGVAIGFVGTSFPIVVALVAAMPGGPALRPYAVLAYASGHLGMMLSPLHLCQVVSNEFFGTSYRPVYMRMAPAALITAALATAYFLLLKLILA